MKENQLKFLRSKNFKIEVSLIILLVMGSVTFSSILDNSFTNWDDPAQLLRNPLVLKLNWSNIAGIFKTGVVSEYHPLVTLLFAVEYHFFGAEPFPYHFHSLLLHLVNGILVFFLLLRWSKKIPVAFLGALLFEIHPLQVQVVAWISARKDLLFTCFYLISFLFYYSYQSNKKNRFYFLSLMFFIASLLSKAVAVTLPVILLWSIYFERKRIVKREWINILPFFGFALMAGLFALKMQIVRRSGSAAHLDFAFENIILAFGNLKFYIVHLLLPVNLSPMYIFSKNISFWHPAAYFSFFLIFSILLWSCRLRYNRDLVWGIGFFIITIFPVLRLIPFGGVEVVSNRFIYLPAVGLFYLFARFGFRLLGGRFPRKWMVIIILIILGLFLAGLSSLRCPVWQDGLFLWREVIARQGKRDIPCHMLGDYYFQAGNFKKAVELAEIAIAENPAMAYSYLLKARANLARGNREEARSAFEEYLEVLRKLGRGDQAEALEKKKDDLFPLHPGDE